MNFSGFPDTTTTDTDFLTTEAGLHRINTQRDSLREPPRYSPADRIDLPELHPANLEQNQSGVARLRVLVRTTRAAKQNLLVKIGLAYINQAPSNIVHGLEYKLSRVRSQLRSYEDLLDETQGGIGERMSVRESTENPLPNDPPDI